jgi:hypothetical protein
LQWCLRCFFFFFCFMVGMSLALCCSQSFKWSGFRFDCVAVTKVSMLSIFIVDVMATQTHWLWSRTLNGSRKNGMKTLHNLGGGIGDFGLGTILCPIPVILIPPESRDRRCRPSVSKITIRVFGWLPELRTIRNHQHIEPVKLNQSEVQITISSGCSVA